MQRIHANADFESLWVDENADDRTLFVGVVRIRNGRAGFCVGVTPLGGVITDNTSTWRFSDGKSLTIGNHNRVVGQVLLQHELLVRKGEKK